MTSVAMWKPPARREYAPKPMDAGQVIVWTVRIDAHWTVPPKYDGGTFTEGIGWVETVEYDRIGTIWSQATSATSWWVVPDDDDPSPVVVRRAGKSYKHHFPEGALYQSGECSGWREGIRRAENVRKRGVYAVVEAEREVWRYGGSKTEIALRWHADPECPDAAEKPRDDGQAYTPDRYQPDGYGATWDVLSIADVMVGRVHLASPGPFCPRCIMLEPAATPARELVEA